MRRTTVPATVLATILLLASAPLASAGEGTSVTLRADGPVQVEVGPFYGADFTAGSGTITVQATDVGGRVTPLPPHDRLQIDATVRSGGREYAVKVRRVMVDDPLGRHGTWWGVGLGVEHHGRSGIGTDELPEVPAALAAFGLGDVSVDGRVVAVGVPVHVMAADEGLPGRLELDVGDPELGAVPGLPDGHLRVVWADYEGEVPQGARRARYAGGIAVLVLLLAAALWLNRRERVEA
jgi:hypothetical protein